MLCMLSSYVSYFLIFLSKPAAAEKLETMRVQKQLLTMDFGDIIVLAVFVLSGKKNVLFGEEKKVGENIVMTETWGKGANIKGGDN